MAAMIDVILYHFILMLFNNGTKDIAIRAQKNVYALPKRTRAAFTYESVKIDLFSHFFSLCFMVAYSNASPQT